MSTFCISVEAAMKFCCKDCGKKEGHQSIPDVSGISITLTSSGYLKVARKKQEGCFQSQQSHCAYKWKGLEAHGRTQTGRLSCVRLVHALSLIVECGGGWWGEGLRPSASPLHGNGELCAGAVISPARLILPQTQG